ncbi:MAG: TIGR01458 family HAD-type hydrolase [Methanothrix sp.]|uniref:TIGR01458 family HAD-type hydrolase n=1 Tax=Methanothrix sp. TaxID=90426 RepID=UPI0025F445EF|nr:TIGR01458 family HAD-type hydrolase [Methanothrix sp.]MCQ8903341.1 TIGR01458 family HAD-type hydrolase [Methanothrix sp.]
MSEIRPSAFLIDLDGVLYVGRSPVPGARECLELMEERGYRFRFISNSTRRCRASVARRLSEMGYSIQPERIFTPSVAAIEKILRSGKRRCYLLSTGDLHRDFEDAGIVLADEDVDFVVVGDAGSRFTFEHLNIAFNHVLEGADMIALEMDRYWRDSDGLVLSAGPFVAALEYATGKRATLVGKPSPDFFNMSLRDMGVRACEAAMVGDDIITDVGGAQRAGMLGILVRTGKYRPELVESSGVTPDCVLDSIADLVRWL